MAASTKGAWPRAGLPAMAAGAWIAWPVWLALMAAMLAAGPWHPREGGGESRADFRYDDGDPPLLVSMRLTGSGPGQDDRVVEPADDVPWTDAPSFADWYPAPLAGRSWGSPRDSAALEPGAGR